jgi:hypothetical protein
MSAPGDDAQRDMEQRALRNVRALVDKIEDKDALDRRSLRKYLVYIVVGMIVLFAIIAGLATIFSNKKEPARTIVIPPPANVAPK